jgi:PKD repeat protein
MKQTTLLTLWVLIIGCVACSPVYEPQFQNPNGIGNTTTTSPSPKPVAQFTFNTTAPLKVIFKNASTSATRYEWSFGDGSTSSEESPTHKYAQKGVYKVKLRATGKAGSDTYETNVTVENPTRIYFDGVTYEKLSVQNEYIKFKLIDDDIFTTVWR